MKKKNDLVFMNRWNEFWNQKLSIYSMNWTNDMPEWPFFFYGEKIKLKYTANSATRTQCENEKWICDFIKIIECVVMIRWIVVILRNSASK